jgi:pilus assembly protein CpaF
MSARIVVVVGAKGGVGATSIAMELMETAPSTAPRIIVDADLTGRRTIGFGYDATGELDIVRAPGSPAVARKNGLTIIEFTRTYEDGFQLQAATVEADVTRFPFGANVVVDAPQPFAAVARPFISKAAAIVLVTEPSLFGISAAHSMLSAMERFGFSRDRIGLVLNNPRGIRALGSDEIAKALKIKIIAELPLKSDRTYGRAFKNFVAAVAAYPSVEDVPNLRQSTARPLGDRRDGTRGLSVTAPASRTPSPVPLPEGAVAAEAAVARPATDTPAVVELKPALHIVSPPSMSVVNESLKTELHGVMMRKIDFSSAARAHTDAGTMKLLRSQLETIASEFLAAQTSITTAEEASRIGREVIEEALGFGPLESLLHDTSVTEIMVNGARSIFVERRGQIESTGKQFVDNNQLRLVIERIIAPLGRRLDESSPMVDARMADGSRVNAVIEPVSIDGPALTIRRFGTRRFTVDDLIKIGAMTMPIVDLMRASIEARLNIIVSGGTGSGKTTLLNAFSSFIPHSDRIVTIEDTAELKLNQTHVVRLEARPPNLEGKGEISIRDLVRNALRMRPDRIIIGECRSGEALDMLQAMNTGHEGSMTTLHANTARDALGRIETMVMMAGFDLPIRVIREQITSAVDMIVQVSRLRDGSRRLVSICEVVGMEGDVISTQELIRYQERGMDAKGVVEGEFVSNGVQPEFLKRFGELGIQFDPVLFNTAAPVALKAPSWLH